MSVQDLDRAVEIDDVQGIRRILFLLCQDKIHLKEPISLLHMAVSVGHIRCVSYLLEREPYAMDADIRDSCLSWTPLMYAVASNDTNMVSYLLSTNKFNLHARDVREQTVLHIAAVSRETTRDMLAMLVQDPSDIEAEDATNRTPFLSAVEANNLTVAQMLYSMDCDARKVTGELQSALHLAVRFCSRRMIRWLIEIGCDVNAEDVDHQTPLMVLVQEKKESDTMHENMRSLIAAGAKLDHHDFNRCSVFLHAISNPLSISKTHLQLLIDNGSDINTTDNSGLSPLWQAVFDASHYAGRTEVVWLLVEHNCDLDRKCCGKLLFTLGQNWIYCYETPLSPFEVALDSSCYGIARLLLYAGCHIEPEMRSDYCQMPIVPTEIYWLQQVLRNVCSLVHLCCISVRRILGRNIKSKVKSLPIPSRLKSYILFENLPFPLDTVSR